MSSSTTYVANSKCFKIVYMVGVMKGKVRILILMGNAQCGLGVRIILSTARKGVTTTMMTKLNQAEEPQRVLHEVTYLAARYNHSRRLPSVNTHRETSWDKARSRYSLMGPFDLFQKKGSKALQAQPLKVRKQVVTLTEPQKPLRSTSLVPPNNTPVSLRKTGSTLAAKARPAKPRSPNPRKRAASGQPRLESDSEEGNTDDEKILASVKRVKLSTDPVPDLNRCIRRTDAFVGGNACQLSRVHAADIAAMDKPTKFKSAFLEHPDAKLVLLQYPSASDMER